MSFALAILDLGTSWYDKIDNTLLRTIMLFPMLACFILFAFIALPFILVETMIEVIRK